MVIFKNENGYNVVNFTLLIPLVFYILFSIIFLLYCGLARSSAVSAATEAANVLGMYHLRPVNYSYSVGTGNYYSPGWVIYNYLHQAHLAGASYMQFNPDTDAVLTDDGSTATVTFTYRFPCPVPGIPRLLDRNAPLWQNPVQIKVRGVAIHEYEQN